MSLQNDHADVEQRRAQPASTSATVVALDISDMASGESLPETLQLDAASSPSISAASCLVLPRRTLVQP